MKCVHLAWALIGANYLGPVKTSTNRLLARSNITPPCYIRIAIVGT